MSAAVVPLGAGITRIDSGYVRPNLDAFYLLIENGRAAFIDTGTGRSVATAVAAVQAAGLAPEQVDYVLPTHVHLDHAGGAGGLMQAFPQAQLVVHPRGARHLIDPTRLIAGSVAVYGEARMQALFGEIVPVAADRVIEADDGLVLELGGRPLRFIDTPGHALHHYCVWDEATRGLFTGDTFGISYREFDLPNGPFIFATTTPVQFDPDAWLATVDRLMALQPEAVYLTHFGRVEGLDRLAADLRADLVDFRDLGLRHLLADDPYPAIRAEVEDHFLQRLERHGVSQTTEQQLELLAMDLDLNSQGIARWLKRRNR